MRNKKILVICPYPKGVAACQRLKYEQYFKSWNDAGYEITVSSFFSNNTWNILWEKGYTLHKICGTLFGYLRRLKDLSRLHQFQSVYVCMWVTPLFDSIFERLFLLKSDSLIYDFDDAIFLNGTNIKGNIFRKYIKNNNKSKLLIKNSSHVITSSPYNLEYCLNINKYNAATYIPCSLDESRFVPITNDGRSELSIGWTGTFTSKVYLDSIKHIIQKACMQYDLKLVLITNFDYHIDGIKMQVIRWKEKTEIEDLQKIDIGLYPLIPSDWALGKGGLKTLQYMSIGIPSISTNFGTATKIVTHKENGFLVNNDEEWLDAIETLVNNKSLRDNLGRRAREHVINNYSIDALSKLYLDVLKQELQ